MGTKIFLHEDFYRQIELIPEENFFAATKAMDSRKPVNASSDSGFETSSERGSLPVKLEKRKIPFQEIAALLGPGAFLHTQTVATGYGDFSERIAYVECWGYEYMGIFAEYRDTDTSLLWIAQSAEFSEDKSGKLLFEKLHALGKQYGLVIVDWNLNIVVRISSATNLRNYLNNEHGYEVLIPDAC